MDDRVHIIDGFWQNVFERWWRHEVHDFGRETKATFLVIVECHGCKLIRIAYSTNVGVKNFITLHYDQQIISCDSVQVLLAHTPLHKLSFIIIIQTTQWTRRLKKRVSDDYKMAIGDWNSSALPCLRLLDIGLQFVYHCAEQRVHRHWSNHGSSGR